MSRYTCHGCNAEHDTDNMVAFCAVCMDCARKELDHLRPDAGMAKAYLIQKASAERAEQQLEEARREIESLKK